MPRGDPRRPPGRFLSQCKKIETPVEKKGRGERKGWTRHGNTSAICEREDVRGTRTPTSKRNTSHAVWCKWKQKSNYQSQHDGVSCRPSQVRQRPYHPWRDPQPNTRGHPPPPHQPGPGATPHPNCFPRCTAFPTCTHLRRPFHLRHLCRSPPLSTCDGRSLAHPAAQDTVAAHVFVFASTLASSEPGRTDPTTDPRHRPLWRKGTSIAEDAIDDASERICNRYFRTKHSKGTVPVEDDASRWASSGSGFRPFPSVRIVATGSTR